MRVNTQYSKSPHRCTLCRNIVRTNSRSRTPAEDLKDLVGGLVSVCVCGGGGGEGGISWHERPLLEDCYTSGISLKQETQAEFIWAHFSFCFLG